jgi:hypothetical protein
MRLLSALFVLLFICLGINVIHPQDNPTIYNPTRRSLSSGDKTTIIETAKKNGIIYIKAINIGVLFMPGGFDPSMISVVEHETIKDMHTISYRILELRNNYWEDSTLSEFSFIKIYDVNQWRISLATDTIDIDIDSSMDYQEAFNLLKMISEKKYTVSRHGMFNISPQKNLKNITSIKKTNKVYEVSVPNSGGGGIYLLCKFRNNRLIIDCSRHWVN